MDISNFLTKPFTFAQRNQLIPCDVRASWKICLVILIIGSVGRKNVCSLKKIHVVNWLVKDKKHLSDFLKWSKSEISIRPEVRLEPSIDRALEIAIGEGLVKKKSGRLELLEKGLEIFSKIVNEDIFEEEKLTIKSAKKYISDANIDRIFKVN